MSDLAGNPKTGFLVTRLNVYCRPTLADWSQPMMIPRYPHILCLITWPTLYFTVGGLGSLGSVDSGENKHI